MFLTSPHSTAKDSIRSPADDSIEFVCSPQPKIDDAAVTAEMLLSRGGRFYKNELKFVFADGHAVMFPTNACKHVLKRNGETNNWDGPRHVFLRPGAAWVRYDTLF